MKLLQGMIITAFSVSMVACGSSTAPETKAENQVTQQETVYENKPSLVVADANGVLDLNAENGAGIGPDIQYMPEWRAFGWFRSTDKVEWEVEVKKTGTYKATLEWSVSDEEAGKEFILEAGNEKLTGIIEKSGSWETFKSAEIGTINLKEGKQKITFKANKPFDNKHALLDLRNIVLKP